MFTFLILSWLTVGAFVAARTHSPAALPVLRSVIAWPLDLLRRHQGPARTTHQPVQQSPQPLPPRQEHVPPAGLPTSAPPAAASPTFGQSAARQGLSLMAHLAVFGLGGGFLAAILIALLTAALGGGFGEQFFGAIIFGFLGFIGGLFLGLIVWGIRGWITTGRTLYQHTRPAPPVPQEPVAHHPTAPQEQEETATIILPGQPPRDLWDGTNPYGCCTDWTDENGYPTHGGPGCLHPQANLR